MERSHHTYAITFGIERTQQRTKLLTGGGVSRFPLWASAFDYGGLFWFRLTFCYLFYFRMTTLRRTILVHNKTSFGVSLHPTRVSSFIFFFSCVLRVSCW